MAISRPVPSSEINAHQAPGRYPSGDVDAGGGLNFGELLNALRRHKWMILGVTVTITALTELLASQQVPIYRASALIRITDQRGAVAGELASTPVGMTAPRADPIQSQLLVMRGEEVLGPVVEREGLRLRAISEKGSPVPLEQVEITLPADSSARVELQFTRGRVEARREGRTARAGYGEPISLDGITFTVPADPGAPSATLHVLTREFAMGWVADGLTARPRSGTDAIDVQFTSTDREMAPRVVNAVVEQYQRVDAASARQLATRRQRFLEGQLLETDSLLAIAQAALIEFRGRQEVFSSREKISALAAAMMELDNRWSELDADRSMYFSLLEGLQGSPGSASETELAALVSTPEIGSNPMIGQLFGQRTQYRTRLDSLVMRAGRAASDSEVRQLNTLLDDNRERLIEAVRTQISFLDARISSVNQLRNRNASEFRQLPAAEAEEARLTQQLSTLQNIDRQLRDEFQRARIAAAVEPGQVDILNTAARAESMGSNHLQQLMLGLILGLLLGSGSALSMEKLNTSIRRAQEMEAILQIPELGIIPPMEAARTRATLFRRGGRIDKERSGTTSRALATESYRMLRTHLALSPSSGELRTLAVTSATSGEGKSTTAANLAISFAQQGARVLLIDCDLWRSRLSRVLGIPASPGLADLLLGNASLESSIQPTRVNGLDVMPCGTRPADAPELLNTRGMDTVLGNLQASYDLLILDLPPVLAVADAVALAARVDSVLVVVRAGSTRRVHARAAMQQLNSVGARVIGGVLNDPDAEVRQYGGYYNIDKESYASVMSSD